MRYESVSMKGFCHFHTETGTEGGYWAFQDSAFIKPPTRAMLLGEWSWEGLHILKDGDHLTIHSKVDPDLVVWDGEISLTEYPPFTSSVFGWWIHADQNGVDRERWAEYFLQEYPGELLPRSPDDGSPDAAGGERI